MRALIFVTLMIGTILVRAASGDGLTQKLQQGLFEEEANRNLEAAIKNYDAVVQQADEQRRVVATAVFRLAECYRKLGRTNEATRYYQRVLRDFSEQEQLVKTSRAVLGADAQQAVQADGPSPAMTQAEADELAKAKSLVQNSPDLVNATPARGPLSTLTPLQSAASAGHYHVCEFLLEHGADPNAGPAPPIVIAAGNGHLRIVELLLNKGADVNATTSQGETALMRAAGNAFRSVLELLLKRGADVNRIDTLGWTAVHSAVIGGDPGVIAFLLERTSKSGQVATRVQSAGGVALPVPVPLSMENGATPLHLAAISGKSDILRLLVEKTGATVDYTNAVGETPLLWAAAAGNTNTMALLLHLKADPNAVTSHGETPLLLAIRKNHVGAVELLVRSRADVNQRIGRTRVTEDGMTHPILTTRNPAVLRAILSGKPRLDVTNSLGVSVAQQFAQDAVLLNLVLEAGADPNADQSPTMGPAITIAVDGFNPDAVRTLLAHGANPNVPYGPQQQSTPLSVTEALCAEPLSPGVVRIGPREKYCEIATLLREHGADPHYFRRRFISFGREEDKTQPVFTRGTNDWNLFTLLETLAFAAHVPNPALSEAYVGRLTHNTTKRAPVNLTTMLDNGCTNDVWMQWGDALIVPRRDQKPGERVAYLPEPSRDALIDCLTREVTMIVDGKTNFLRLVPTMVVGLPRFFSNHISHRHEIRISNFYLKSVVLGSNLLRASSDQSAVRVTRVSPENKTTNTWVVDLTTIPRNQDIWVRAGDVIEIPERK